MGYKNAIQHILRDKGRVELDGVELKMIPGKETGEGLDVGDYFVAERVAPPRIMKVGEIRPAKADGPYYGQIVPEGHYYGYELYECVGVTVEGDIPDYTSMDDLLRQRGNSSGDYK